MTILVTGGAGYVGAQMVKCLVHAGFQPIVVDDLRLGRVANVAEGVQVQVGDIGDSTFINQIVSRARPRAVMHFAGSSQVGESIRDPASYYGNNVAATHTLLEAMRQHHVARLVFSSTAAIFGEPLRTPIDEDHPKAPVSPYGRSKWMIEQMLADYGTAYGLRSICLRYFNAAGADPQGATGECHDPETHLIPLVLQVASGRRASISIYGDDYDTRDGTCVRDYIHVQDLCDAHLLALKHLLAGGGSAQYNLGNGQGFSVREVIDAARRVTKHPIPEVIEARRAGDPVQLIADARRAHAQLRWKPHFDDLETIIRHAWQWERRHPGWLT